MQEKMQLASKPKVDAFEDVYGLEAKIGKGAYLSVHITQNRKAGDEFAVKVIDCR